MYLKKPLRLSESSHRSKTPQDKVAPMPPNIRQIALQCRPRHNRFPMASAYWLLLGWNTKTRQACEKSCRVWTLWLRVATPQVKLGTPVHRTYDEFSEASQNTNVRAPTGVGLYIKAPAPNPSLGTLTNHAAYTAMAHVLQLLVHCTGPVWSF